MKTIDEYLTEARKRLARLTPEELPAAIEAGALVVDIRSSEQRERDGELEGAVAVPRNVLEWRLAPSSDAREYELDETSHVVIVCDQGYQSSLAAAALQDLGLTRATDVIGGYQAIIGGTFDPNG